MSPVLCGARGLVGFAIAAVFLLVACDLGSSAIAPAEAPARAVLPVKTLHTPRGAHVTLASDEPDPPAEQVQIDGDGGRPVEIYPPLSTSDRSRAPLTVMIHGMCSTAAWTCDFWSAGARDGGWLACPTGNGTCGDVANWDGPTEGRIASVDASLGAVDAAFGAHLDHAGDVLIGFSRGAYVARDYLYARKRAFRGVIFIGAFVTPDVAKLRAAGVERVVFASGDFDGARATMQHAATLVAGAGMPARFVSLGPMGHGLPGNLDVVLRKELAWLREKGSS